MADCNVCCEQCPLGKLLLTAASHKTLICKQANLSHISRQVLHVESASQQVHTCMPCIAKQGHLPNSGVRPKCQRQHCPPDKFVTCETLGSGSCSKQKLRQLGLPAEWHVHQPQWQPDQARPCRPHRKGFQTGPGHLQFCSCSGFTANHQEVQEYQELQDQSMITARK